MSKPNVILSKYKLSQRYMNSYSTDSNSSKQTQQCNITTCQRIKIDLPMFYYLTTETHIINCEFIFIVKEFSYLSIRLAFSPLLEVFP